MKHLLLPVWFMLVFTAAMAQTPIPAGSVPPATVLPLRVNAPDAVSSALRLLATIEAQRNWALTQHAMAEARAAGLAEDLARANARIKELEPKPESPPAAPEK